LGKRLILHVAIQVNPAQADVPAHQNVVLEFLAGSELRCIAGETIELLALDISLPLSRAISGGVGGAGMKKRPYWLSPDIPLSGRLITALPRPGPFVIRRPLPLTWISSLECGLVKCSPGRSCRS
jgi:hypothetical protein